MIWDGAAVSPIAHVVRLIAAAALRWAYRNGSRPTVPLDGGVLQRGLSVTEYRRGEMYKAYIHPRFGKQWGLHLEGTPIQVASELLSRTQGAR